MARQDPLQVINGSRPQYQLCVRTFAPWPTFGGFEGDNRSFSTSPDATFRTGGFLVFDLADGTITEGPAGVSSGTRTGSDEAKVFSEVSASVSNLQGDSGRITFRLTTAGANPMIPMSPDIDVNLFFVSFMRDGDLFIAGRMLGDGFPNAEVFVRDAKGHPFQLMTFRTDHGPNTGPITLIGDGTDDMGSFKVGIMLDDDHSFIGSLPFDG